MKIKHKIIIGLVPLILAAAAVIRITATSRSADPRRANATLVQVETPRRGTIVHDVVLNGDVLSAQQAQIFAKVYGTLERVQANMGDFVREGQVLAQIDTTELAQQFQQAAATYQNVEANYGRARQLADRDLAAKQDLDNLDASLKVARANYDNARTRLGYALITAPFTGYITRRYLDPGAVLTANNATLFTLMDLSSVKIIVNVLEKDVPLVGPGTGAQITVDALPGKRFAGSIARSANALDPATRTMAVEIDIPNPDRILKPGMFATVSLRVGEDRDALTLPVQAILKDDKGTYVYVADDKVARRHDVTIGSEQQSRLEILSGLQGDEPVITTGQQLVKDGAPITIQP